MANKPLDIVSLSRMALSEGISFQEAKARQAEADKEARQDSKKGNRQNVKAHDRKPREEHFGSLYVGIGTQLGGEDIFQVKGRFPNKRALHAEQAINFVQALTTKEKKGLDLNKIRCFWVNEDSFIIL